MRRVLHLPAARSRAGPRTDAPGKGSVMNATTVRKLKPFGWVKEIPRESGRYLTRWSLREQKLSGGGGWRMYLHRFWAGDLELHDHPWKWSFSLILWGSYTETYADLIECP